MASSINSVAFLYKLLAEAEANPNWDYELFILGSGRAIRAWDEMTRCQFLLTTIEQIGKHDNVRYQNVHCRHIVSYLLAWEMPFSSEQLIAFFDWLADYELLVWMPFDAIVKQVKHYLKDGTMTPQLSQAIQQVTDAEAIPYHYAQIGTDIEKLKALANVIGTAIPIVANEAWSDVAIAEIGRQTADQQTAWSDLLHHTQSASGGKPSSKWSVAARELLAAVGFEAFKAAVVTWFPLVDKPPTILRERQYEWQVDPNLLILDTNADILKGLAWFCGEQEDRDIARALAGLAVSAYRKVPQKGARCVRLGNACVWALGYMPGTVAIGQLALLKVRVKFGTAQKGIEKALMAAAEREGMPLAEIEEMAVPTYGLSEVGVREEVLGAFTAVLQVTGTSSTQIIWRKADGKLQKSVPKAVKDNFADELKALKQQAKDIQKMMPAQRDRIENLYLSQKVWTYGVWRERYLDHPLVGTIVRRLLWRFTDGERGVTAVYHNGQLVDVMGQVVDWLTDQCKVTLWHPLEESTELVLAWREWLEQHEIQQPFKQAHREIYLLTDAERQTETYSNRFAAHILRQHQFNSLCAVRGWRNKLRLMVDDDYPPAMRDLPEWGLRAEYWIEGIGDNYGIDTTETGTYLYVATDQVRFYRLNSAINYAHAGGGSYRTWQRDEDEAFTPLRLTEIPPLVFSEIMRDVDLFVGVGSVGNDPNWVDGGSEGRYVDYWHRYSFGNLSQTAETRRTVLATLLPKLKIGAKCQIVGRFLEVEGTYRTYKIHLGSGNILMTPNDQYLCIVPSSSRASAKKQQVFLPFEGDRVLAIILSKAMLLANDTAIKDTTIVRQIRR